MAESCSNPRDRALILLIYETGGRIGEILSLCLGAISFDKYGATQAKLQNSKSEIEKNELIKLQLAILTAWFNSIILSQLEQIQQVSSFVEFGPLVKAAKGQKVPINQLKSAVIKALDILISSDPTLSIGMVKTTRQFLENDFRKSGNIAP